MLDGENGVQLILVALCLETLRVAGGAGVVFRLGDRIVQLIVISHPTMSGQASGLSIAE